MLSITNIPVMVGSNFVYTPAVHRLLQLAANLYDATTNGNHNLPHVFRPVFERDNNPTVKNRNVYIVGYVPVTYVSGVNDLQLSAPQDVTQLASYVNPNTPIVNGSGPVNVYGVPWIIGAKKDLPGFNQFHLISTAQVTRKLQITRTKSDPATATYITNQMYVFSMSNSVGISFWNSYSNNYPRPLTVYAQNLFYMTLTNNNGNVWSGFTNLTINNLPVGVGWTIPAWPGSHWSGTPPNATPRANSFFTNDWGFYFMPPSVYRFNSGTFVPADSLTISQWETPPTFAQLPPIGLAITNYLQAFVLDGNNVIDYVQLRDPINTTNLNRALADLNYPQPGNVYLQWSTNAYPVAPAGVINQLWVSGHPPNVPFANGWSTAPTVIPGDTTPPAEGAFFNGFFAPRFQYLGQNYTNSELVQQAPYTPSRTIYTSYLLQANDPLVHSLASDLNGQNGALAVWAGKAVQIFNGFWYQSDDAQNQPLPTPPATPIGGRYQPWGQSKQMAALPGVDINAYNLAYRDPLAWGSDNWDFPTNLYPTVGWIGRVHRGTPWQTGELRSGHKRIQSGLPSPAGLGIGQLGFPDEPVSDGRLDWPGSSRHAVAGGGSQVHEHSIWQELVEAKR